MRIAVLADVHANYVALQKCIDYALERNITTFIFLGDYVGDLAYPQKTMELIYSMKNQYPCYFVKGNKEDYWLNYRVNGEQGWKDDDSTTGCLLYTYQQLRERDKNDLILCGHSHIQRKFEHGGKIILNPGSVGVPFHSDGKAQFLVLQEEDKKWVEEFISIDYNVEKAIEDLYEAGLYEKAPCWCKVSEYTLRNGDITHGAVLARAMELCKQEVGACVWPDVPEKYWEQAVAEMIKKCDH